MQKLNVGDIHIRIGDRANQINSFLYTVCCFNMFYYMKEQLKSERMTADHLYDEEWGRFVLV